MEWLNIHTSTLESEAFMDASPLQHSIWLQLLRHCATQENGGKIKGLRQWGAEKVLITTRCQKADLVLESPLWMWNGDDLCVEFYPLRAQKEVQSKRKGGKAGATARWAKAAEPAHKSNDSDHTEPVISCPKDGPENGSPNGSAINTRNQQAIGSANAEGKEREGKGSIVCSGGGRNFIAEAESLVALWPKARGRDAAKLSIIADLELGTDPAVIRSGTVAIAAVVEKKAPGGANSNRYVANADTFFQNRSWQDDPASYERQWEAKEASSGGISAAFGSERTQVANPRINGLP